jgi:hypothetical protein
VRPVHDGAPAGTAARAFVTVSASRCRAGAQFRQRHQLGSRNRAAIWSASLVNNRIGDAGAAALSEALKSNATLTSL